MLSNTDHNISVLNGLRGLGVTVALDDFGTGYSSLGYLQSFPFDRLKIDRCFVHEIETEANKRAIFRAVISLAGALGIKTIAEGIETEAELACVRAEGCEGGQGYLTGRPLSAEAAMELLRLTADHAL